MSSITSMLNQFVDKGLATPIDKIVQTRFAKYSCENYRKDNLKFIGALGIASIALKDGLGGYMYVTQSLNNKKIPEEKRKFVAALDLTNCGLMIASQILMFLTISNKKVQERMFNGIFKKIFDSPVAKTCEEKIRNNPKFKDLSTKEFSEIFGKFKKDVSGFFGIFTSLVASTIIAKRVFVPFLATPLADKAKKAMCKNDKQDTFTHKAEN